MKDKEVQFIEQILSHPRNRMRRTIGNTPAKVLVDRQVLEDIPPPNNDQYYIKHDEKTDTFTVKKYQKRRAVKRKATSSVLAANKSKTDMDKEEKIRTHEQINNKKVKNLYNALDKNQTLFFIQQTELQTT